MALSRLEKCLSYHARALLPHVLSRESSHRVAYVFSLICAMSSGFITLIALYSKPWHLQLGYSAWQVNTIVSVTNLGMYLTPPVLGWLADTHGPITLSALAILGFIPSYAYAGYSFNNPEFASFRLTLAAFVVIGISTSALYFSALLTCAKLCPRQKILSISLPTTCYGISSLLGSQLLRADYFWSAGHLNLGSVFNTFACLYGAVGLLAWIATSTVSMLHHHDPHVDEQQPLLPVPADERLRQKSFFHDGIAYVLALSMLLALGPLEMFVANMGSFSNLVSNDSAQLSNQMLSIYALSSTVARLFTGLLTDVLSARKISAKWVLISHLLLCLLCQLGALQLTQAASLPPHWRILSMGALIGFVYGGLYTIYPTVVLIVWGDKLFGTAYGSMMIAPAIGAALSCMGYAKVFDANCAATDGDNNQCIAPVFKITSVQIVCSLVVTQVALRAWKRRDVPI